MIDRLHAEPRTAATAAYGFALVLIGCEEDAENSAQASESRLIICCADSAGGGGGLADSSTHGCRLIQISRQPHFGIGFGLVIVRCGSEF